MSQSAVARQIGVGQSTISRMVRAEGKHSHV
jgi:DNA-binding MurR/RpiR family transcriptional regulator